MRADDTAFVRTLVDENTLEWSPVFADRGRVYAPPRLLFVSPPRHHPSRGFGYAPGIGLVIDLGEAADLHAVYKTEAERFIALIVAHEIAHHVQYLNEDRARLGSAQHIRELEADCAAGWWLGRSNARSLAATGKPRYATADLDRRLPQLFDGLRLLKEGLRSAREHQDVAPELSNRRRVAQFELGATSASVSACGAGVTP